MVYDNIDATISDCSCRVFSFQKICKVAEADLFFALVDCMFGFCIQMFDGIPYGGYRGRGMDGCDL